MVKWTRPPVEVVQEYEARRSGRGDSGALIIWATWAVEGIDYLIDIHDRSNRGQLSIEGHSPEIVAIAHVRWATSSSITAIDLCAAVLARECCGWSGHNERDLRDFDPSVNPKSKRWRDPLPARALSWVDTVLSDQRYKEIQGARNPLTHSRLLRRLYSSGPDYTEFVITSTGSSLSIPELMLQARTLATDSVAEFLKVVEATP